MGAGAVNLNFLKMKRAIDISTVLLFISVCLLTSCNKKDEPATDMPDTDAYVTDVCGNKYRVVEIGGQTWMAENMRCDTYDTQSEKPGEKIQYINVGDRSLWKDVDCVNLTDEQVSKFGYRYVLYYPGSIYAPQSICPNGWHIPDRNEWTTLLNYGSDKTSNFFNNDSHGVKRLKSKDGWYSCDEKYKNGTDYYSFNVLPIGYIDLDGKVANVGKTCSSVFVSNTNYGGNEFYELTFAYDSDECTSFKAVGGAYHSVRCIKDGSLWFLTNINENRYYEVKGDSKIKINVGSNYLCVAESNKDWVACETKSGSELNISQPFNSQIILSVDANNTDVDDVALVTFSAANVVMTTISIHRLPVK